MLSVLIWSKAVDRWFFFTLVKFQIYGQSSCKHASCWSWSRESRSRCFFFLIFFQMLLSDCFYVAAPIVNWCDAPMGERGRKKKKKQWQGRKGSIASKSWMGVTPWSSTQGAAHEPHFTAHSQYHMVAWQEREKPRAGQRERLQGGRGTICRSLFILKQKNRSRIMSQEVQTSGDGFFTNTLLMWI